MSGRRARVRSAPSAPAPELFALGCDIVEECVAEVSKAYAKGVN